MIVEERILLALDPARLHFYVPETSETLRPGVLASTAYSGHPVAAAAKGARTSSGEGASEAPG